MRCLLVLAAAAAVIVEAQKSGCKKTTEVTALPDPLKQITPGKAVFPCDFGSQFPSERFQVAALSSKSSLVRSYAFATDNRLIPIARGTSEPGELGMIVGDPLVARVKRDMPGVNVRGYPVQVSCHCLLSFERRVTECVVPCRYGWRSHWCCRCPKAPRKDGEGVSWDAVRPHWLLARWRSGCFGGR